MLTAQNYVKAYRDDEQKRLSGIERKPRKGCPGKLNEAHTRFLTQLANQNLTAVLHSTRYCVFRQGFKSLRQTTVCCQLLACCTQPQPLILLYALSAFFFCTDANATQTTRKTMQTTRHAAANCASLTTQP
ncbi:hypothetical protein BX070DRAFT_225774, partial [Coemansia spiralis]